jgi:alpha-tubulin suppressor-like RCC1 family protein
MAAALLALLLIMPGWADVWGQTFTENREHSLVICEAGNVISFGNNALCQLGQGSDVTATFAFPTTVPGTANAVAVAVGSGHSLMLLSDGTVWAWGRNQYGATGVNPSTGEVCSPTQVSLSGCAVAIAAGDQLSLALLADGTVWAWGFNNNGQLGNATTTNSHTPVQVSGITTAKAISAGNWHALALLADGTVKAWGQGNLGQMGNNTTVATNSTPVTASGSGFSGIVQIAAGGDHNVARKSNGDIYVWGNNGFGQLGRGTGNYTQSLIPIQSTGLSSSSNIDIAAGASFSVVLRTGGSTKVCGDNTSRQLGIQTGGVCSSTSNYPNPANGPTITNAIDIWAPSTGKHTLAITDTGDLYAWGSNVANQLGNGGSGNICIPALINDPIIEEEELGYYCPAKPSSDNHPQPCCVAVHDDERTVLENQVFTTSQTYNNLDMAIFGTVTLNGGTHYFNGCNVVMGKDAKIIVNYPATLRIYGVSHLYACGDMWDGIEVNNRGHVRVYGNSTIEDAEIALDIEDGAYYYIYQANFNKNYRHISITDPAGTPYNAVQRIRSSKFLCQNSISDPTHTNLLPPRQNEYTWSQISAVDVRGLLVGSSGYGNTFDHAVFGVTASGVPQVEVLYNAFTDVIGYGTWAAYTPTSGGETIEIVHNQYLRSQFPIFCFDNGTTVEANITDNEIEFDGMGSPPPVGMRGISVEEISMPGTGNYNKYNISNNDIFNATTGVYLENLRGTQVGTTASLYIYDNRVTQKATSTDQGAGIRLENVVEAAIIDNEVSHPSNSVNWHDHGIRVSNGNSNAIFCNHLHDIGNGLWFDGYQTTQTEVATNTFYRNGSAFLLNWGDIGPQPISSSGYDPHDNQWTETGTWWDAGANRYTTNVLGTHTHTTQFRVRSSAPSVYYPDENQREVGGMFVGVSVIGGSWQNSCQVFNGPSFKADSSEQETASAKPYLNVISPAEPKSERETNQQWLGQYGLLDRLAVDEEMRSSAPELESFFTENATSNMGRLHAAVNGFRAARNGQIEGNYGLTAMQQVQPVNNVEQTLKQILELLYANATDLAALSDNEIEQMREIARRCPLDCGFGVYMARAALLNVDTFPRSYTHECELAQPLEDNRSKKGPVSADGQFFVYPNPSNGWLTIEYQLDENETGQIEVFDLSGRSVYDSTLSSGRSTAQIRLENLQSGLYLLRIAVNGSTKLSERISVFR